MTVHARAIGEKDLALGLLGELLRERRCLIARARELKTPVAGRDWIRITDSPDADAWLIAWSPASSVGTHDHGGSHGAVTVLRGSLVERYWESDDRWAHVRKLARGATVSVPPDRQHDIANCGTRPALSLHVYSPRLSTMSFYPGREQAGDRFPQSVVEL